VVMIIWWIHLQLPVESVTITTEFVRCTPYNIMW